MANAEHIPPPEVLRSQRNVMANERGISDRNGAGSAQGTDPNSENDEWAQPMDYWYNRVISKSSPAATTANPSALGLIAFGYTTALLQVNMACMCVSTYARVARAVATNVTYRTASTFHCYQDLPRVTYAHLGDLLEVQVPLPCMQGANTHWTEATTPYVTSAFALFFGGLVQLLAGMWEFRRNNMFAATALSSYGGFWLSYGIYLILAAGGVIPESGTEGLQMMLSLWGILTFFYFV